MKDLQITIGFSTTNKLMSRIIRWVTRGNVSHAWIAFYDHCLDTRLVMQAETWGYEVRPWERWQRENILIAEFKTQQDMTISLRWIAPALGAKYDWTSAFFSGVKRWLGRWVKSHFNSPKKLMCAEAVIRFLQHSGSYAVSNLDPETTTPASLLRAVNTSSEFQKVER